MKCSKKAIWMNVVIGLEAMVFGMAPMNVYAQAGKMTEEPKMETIEVDVTEDPKQEESFGPLTPDGNLILVDDYGAPEGGGKQFITVVTKSGNYFYIIIDRDDEGDETVHFLNMVDESDLLALMDDEEAKAYVESVTKEETVEEETKENQSVSAGEVTAGEDTGDTPKKKKTGAPKAILPIAAFAMLGGGAFLFMGKGKGKKSGSPKVDPDAGYSEDDEKDYLDEVVDKEEIETEEREEQNNGD